MRQCTFLWFALASLLTALPALGDDPDNAATWYQRALDRLDVLSEDDWTVIEDYRANPGPPSPRLREVLAKAGPMLNDYRRGSQQEYADYGLDFSEGYSMTLPHLGALRAVAKVMQADAYMHLLDGDDFGAAQRVSAMYRAAGHLSDDRTMISSLVGRAVYGVADEIVQRGLDQTALSSASANELARALAGMDDRDPFGIREAVAGEKALVFDYLAVRFETEEGRRHIREELPLLIGSEEGGEQLAALTDDEFYVALEQYDGLMDQIVIAFDMDDRTAAQAELDRIEGELEAGEHGVLAQVMTPTFKRVYGMMADVRETMDERQATLEKLARGQIDPASLSNAALDYHQAIAQLGKLEPEQRGALLAYGRGGDAHETLAADLEAIAAIIEVATVGAAKRRCDFTALDSSRPVMFCPPDVAGMHDLLGALLADARHRLHADDDDAVPRLVLLLRVIGHLSGDGHVMSALVSHDAFGRVVALVEGAGGKRVIDDEARTELAAAVRRISYADPFGYVAALESLRRVLSAQVRRWPVDPEDADAAARRIEASRLLGEWSGARLVYLFAVYDAMNGNLGNAGSAGEANADEGAVEPARRLNGIIDPADLDMISAQLPIAAAVLTRHDVNVFVELGEWPRLGSFDERHRAARSDLRKGAALFFDEPRQEASSSPDAP